MITPLEDFSLSEHEAFFLQQAFFSPAQAGLASAAGAAGEATAEAVPSAAASAFAIPAQAFASPAFILQQEDFFSHDFLSFFSLSSSLETTTETGVAVAMYPEPTNAVSRKAIKRFFIVFLNLAVNINQPEGNSQRTCKKSLIVQAIHIPVVPAIAIIIKSVADNEFIRYVETPVTHFKIFTEGLRFYK